MSIIKTVRRENPFVQMDTTSIGDAGLSLKATGLLVYLMSKPHNWQVRPKDIQNRFTDGRDSVNSGIKELEKAGFINKYHERNENGEYDGMVYEVYERAEYNPSYNGNVSETTGTSEIEPKTGNPNTVKQELENPSPSNMYSSNMYSSNIQRDTYKDTENVAPSITEQTDSKEKEKFQDELLKDSFQTDVPPKTFTTLKALTDNYQEMYDYIGVIFRAKEALEQEDKQKDFIWLNEELDDRLNMILLKAIREIKRTGKIKNPKNYVYQSIYNSLLSDFE